MNWFVCEFCGKKGNEVNFHFKKELKAHMDSQHGDSRVMDKRLSEGMD